MAIYPINIKGQVYRLEGDWNPKTKCLDLHFGDYVFSIACRHKDDLDSINEEIKKTPEIIAAMQSKSQPKPGTVTISEHCDNVLNGLTTIMDRYPLTKGRLASLTSQVKKVLSTHGIK